MISIVEKAWLDKYQLDTVAVLDTMHQTPFRGSILRAEG